MPEAGSIPRRPAGRRPNAFLVPAIALALASIPGLALAQYKWVGADGTVHYGDRPPQQAAPIGQSKGAANASTAAVLPYELRQTAQRYPVTLYTTPDCPPCALARSHLVKRGIPFAAREVRTQDDATAFHALGFADLSFPALRVGRERVSGFEPGGWDRLLDSAAYPKSSRLPPRWQAPRAEPLAPPAAPPVAAAPQQGTEAIEALEEAVTGSLDTAEIDSRRMRASETGQPTIRF